MNDNNTILILQKINPLIFFNYIYSYLDKENKYKLPLVILNLDNEYQSNLNTEIENILKNKNTNPLIKHNIRQSYTLYKFFKNLKKIYIEKFFHEYSDITQFIDPINEMLTRAENESYNIKEYVSNYKKYFYYFLLNLPYINISLCTSLTNCIYWKDYYEKNNAKKQKVINVILYLKEELSKMRINDFFQEIIFDQKNYIVKNKKIIFNSELFMNVINNIYQIFNEPRRIIVYSEDKDIKHNFKNKTEFIINSILFKLLFKSEFLLIIHRV